MGRYKQKINEKASIDKSLTDDSKGLLKGFVGVIANKSNVTIDNSYIEKGTAFVNAFENSNVILKNCGTPIPTSESNENIVNKTVVKLSNEIDRKTLPFFVHHKIARFDDVNLNINDNNPTLSRLEVINEYDINNDEYKQINEFRHSIGENARNDEERGHLVCDSKYLLENQILRSKNLTTKDVDYTISGLYYLSGLTSSIKAVFPLNLSLKTNFDNPKLNLNYINREIFNYKINDSFIGVKDVNKLDSFGNEIDIPGSDTISIAPITRKYIVASSLNKPIETNSSVYLKTLSGNPVLNFNNYENLNYFESGPYLNNSEYISYYKNDKTTKGKLLINDIPGKETDFYFKVSFDRKNYTTFSLREIINNRHLYENSDESTLSGYAWKYYLNSGEKINNDDCIIKLDTISEFTGDYHPENIPENCNFYGFKFQNLNSLWSSSNTEFDFYDNENNKITNEIFGKNFDSIPALFNSYWINPETKNAISLNDYLDKKYYVLTNNGSFDLDDNIVSQIGIVANLSGTATCPAEKNDFIVSSSIASSLYFPLKYSSINDISSFISENDFINSENYKLIQNYKLIIDLNEATKQKLIDPVSSSITFYLNIPMALSTIISDSTIISKEYYQSSSISNFSMPSKWQVKCQVTNTNYGTTPATSSYIYEPIIDDYLEQLLPEYLGKMKPITSWVDNKNNEKEVNVLSDIDISLNADVLCGTCIPIYNCRIDKMYESDLNIIRDNDKTKNTLDEFFEGTWNNNRTFGFNNDLDENEYVNTMLSSVISNSIGVGENNLFKYKLPDNSDTLTYKQGDITIEGKIYENVFDFLKYSLPGNPSYTSKSSPVSFDLNENNKFIPIDILNVPVDVQNEFKNIELPYWFKSVDSINLELEEFKNTIFTDLYPSSINFVENISGYFEVTDEGKLEKPVISPSASGLFSATTKDGLDIEKTTQYFRDMIGESRIGSNINSYSNISGNFVNLIHDLFKNGKISKVNRLLNDYENPNEIVCEKNTTPISAECSDISGIFYSKDEYLSNKNSLSGLLSGKLNDLIKEQFNSRTSSEPKYEFTNDFDFEIIDVVLNKELSNYAYFGFVLYYKHDVTLVTNYNESEISYSSGGFHETTTNNQTINFLHYTSGNLLPLPSRFNGSIYDYANSISGLYMLSENKDFFEISNVDDIIDSKEEIKNKYLTFIPLNDLENGLPALSSKYKDIYFNGINEITFKNDDYLLIDDKTGVVYSKNIESTLTGGIYVNPGVKLTTSILNDDIPSNFVLEYDGSKKLLKCAQNIDLKIQSTDPIKLYYDFSCSIPMAYDIDTNELYDHAVNGKKIFNENKVESSEGDKITKYSYKKLREFKYETTTIKELATFNDWYNVDTYINYSNIDNNENLKKYTLSIKGNYRNQLSSYFSNNSFKLLSLNDSAYLELLSNNEDVSLPIINGGSESSTIHGFDNNFKSIFNKRPDNIDKYQGYKLFSFNFKIPSKGWHQFDEVMYRENPNWKKDIISNRTSYNDIIPNVNDLKTKSIKGLSSSFEGEFIAGYSIFNRRYEYDSTATKFKTYKLELIPLYMSTHNGKLCDTKTGVVSGAPLSGLKSSEKNNLDLVGYYNVPELNNNSTVSGAITINDISYPVYSSDNIEQATWVAGNGNRIFIYPNAKSWSTVSSCFKNDITINDVTDNVNGIVTNDSYVSGNFKPSDLIDVLGLDSYSYYSTSFHWTANIKGISSDEKQLNLTSNNDTLAFSLNLKESEEKIYEGIHNLQGFIFSINVKQNGKTEARNIIIPSLEIYAKYSESNNELYLSVDSYESSELFNLFSESSDIIYSAVKNYKINDVAEMNEKYYVCTKAINNLSNWTQQSKTSIDTFSLDNDYYSGDVFYFEGNYYQFTTDQKSIWRKIENIEAFEILSNYNVGDVTTYGNRYYYCTKPITSIWKRISNDDYSIANSYSVNDVIKYDGKFYKCGLAQSPYWIKLSFEEFKTGGNYPKGTVVIYNNVFYYSKNKNGITNAKKWEKGKWGKIDHYLLSKGYAVNNYMFYDGVPYKCSEKTKAFWKKIKINKKFSEKQKKYNDKDCVLYNGVPYICKNAVTSAGKFNSSNWEKIIDYSMIEDYEKNDVVKFNGEYFKCTNPITLNWTKVLNFAISQGYAANAIVFYDGDIIKSTKKIDSNYGYFNKDSGWAEISSLVLDNSIEKNSVWKYGGSFYESMESGTAMSTDSLSKIENASYDSEKTYDRGTVILYNGEFYECEKSGSKIEFSLSNWKEIEEYSSRKSYSKGSLVVKDKTVFKALTSISANSTWDKSKWTVIISNVYDINKNLVYDSNNLISKSSQFYLDLKRQNDGNDFNEINLSNIASIKTQNEIGYPLEWMTIGQIGFSKSTSFVDNVHKMGIKGASKTFNGKRADENNPIKKNVYDIERFVKPFDMSTNLFYYKASSKEENRYKDTIASDDEVIIINARKMYNQVPDEVEKPEGGSLDFRLASLYNKEFILTGYIPLTGNASPFEEQYIYRNNNYEYIISGNEVDTINTPISEQPYEEQWHECRYTDYLNSADQWKLYKLNNKIIFSTTNNFSAKLYPKSSIAITSDGNRFAEQDEKNSIEIPCKISMSFDNLFFKEKIRTGVSFDNVSDLSFTSRIFPNSMIDSGYSALSSRWELIKIGSSESLVSGMTLENSELIIDKNNPDAYGYLCEYYIDSNTPSSLLFGGSEYYNDVLNMNIVSNSVNRWSTSYVSHKYEKLKVLSDYCPQKDDGKLIGTPYCNLLSTIFVKETIYHGTSSGGEGTIAGEFTELGGVVKIAEDFKYINNIKYASSFDDIEDYPNNPDLITSLSYEWDDDISPYGKNTYIKKYMISGELANLSITGKKKFDIGNNSFYIYFDGLLYEKEVAINDNSESIEFITGGPKYNIVSIIESTVSVENDGSFEGYIAFELCLTSNLDSDMVEIHNVKMPCPSVNSIGISYNKDYLNLLDENGYFIIDDDTWQKKVFLEDLSSNLKMIAQEEMIFTLQEENELRSSIEIDYNDYGKPVGIFVSLTFPGLNKFAGCESKFFLENAHEMEIKNIETLEQYKNLEQFNLDKYKSNATIGDTILTGALNFEYNKLITTNMNSSFTNVGNLKYVYNPKGKNDFQLEVITKEKNSDRYNKDLYYINKPVDKWYNLGIYRWDKDNVNTKGEYEKTSKIGFMLNEIESDKINEISSKGNEIFNCTVTNDLIIDGINVDSSIIDKEKIDIVLGLNDVSINSMYNYKTLMTLKFDPCSRAPWNTWQTTDLSNLINSTNITELDYENRRGKDLYSVTEFSFDKISIVSSMFTNEYEVIKIFANEELEESLNTGIENTLVSSITSNLIPSKINSNMKNTPYFINYASLINGKVNTEYSSLNAALNTFNNSTKNDVTGIRDYLNRYIPRRIMLNESANNYVLDLKDTKYHISPVQGIEAKNIMFVSSPNLSIYTNESDYVHYVENYNDSLKLVNDYIDYFNNPQHRLPAVEYNNHILSSDFATFIYNSCNKFKAINVDQVDEQLEVLNFNYDNVPDRIANVWDNSQVTRNESIINGQLNPSKLYWTKSSSEEFITEVGSLYNYQNSTYMTNIVKIETGSINERQTILMPVLSDPFEFEQRSAESGVIKVTDQIIATAALGYNSTGYPINSILQYNSNGSVSIDTTQTQYLYISQQESYNDCYFGATEQKPVYVDAIQQNTQSLSEKFTFLPNPSISNELTGQDVDQFLIQYYGGNLGEFDANDSDEKLFLLPFVKNNAYYYPKIDETVIKDICYSCANNFKEHSVYSYATNDISGFALDETGVISNYTNNNSTGKYVTFIGNLLSFKIKSDVSIKKESLNVFFNEKEFDKMVEDLGGIDVERSFETMNCFGYDGLLIPSSLWNSTISGFADDPSMVTGNYNDIKIKLNNYSKLFEYTDEVDMEPTIGVIWKNIDVIENFANYNKIVNANIGDNPNNRHAIFDEYYSTNITGFKLKIKNEHLSSAPVYIKVSLLKIVKTADGGGKFAWWNDPILDLNLTDSYENIYDYSSVSDKEIEKMFINYPDKAELIKHSYGIKFTIKQIVPQQKQNNKCIIDNIEIYTSNILNKYGIGVSVEDTFVRKADANCRNSYQMNVNEYIWHIPKNKAEWRNVYDVLSGDAESGNYNLIDEDSYKVISELILDLSKPNNSSIDAQIQNGNNFSYMSTYYFTNSNASSNKITEVLSDNYLVDSNIKVSWKYIDYVYISYECYSPNSMDLLNVYFGKKIYNAVKAKLLLNIDNMNSNSAFKDKYKFSGGIAKSKHEDINSKTNNAAFEWKNNINKDQWNTYRNCYTKSGSTSESYATELWQTNVYRDTYINGIKAGSKLMSSTINKGDTKKLSDQGASQTLEDVNREHIGQTTVTESSTVLENTKYSSVSEWTKTFMPIAIKFKIN